VPANQRICPTCGREMTPPTRADATLPAPTRAHDLLAARSGS
jgi:hypothetical protein